MWFCTEQTIYHNDPKFWDRQVWANNVDPHQGLQGLPFRLRPLDALFYGKATLFIFLSDYSNVFGCKNC